MDNNPEAPVLSHGQMKAMSSRMKQARDERFLEQSRKRLDKIVSTKIRTAFIGALAAFEEEFGTLWGGQDPEDELTSDQQDMRELWNRARTNVLNNGNTQLRAVRNEIANHVIKWNRYHLNLPVHPLDSEESTHE